MVTFKEEEIEVCDTFSDVDSNGGNSTNSSDEDYHQPSSAKKVRYNTKKLPALSEMADRSHVSDRVAASLANAAMKYLGLISQEDNTMVFERSIFADKGCAKEKKTG